MKFIIFLSLLFSAAIAADPYFVIENQDSLYYHGQKIVLLSTEHRYIGQVSYIKLSLSPYAIVHSLYVDPAYRGQGNAKSLLQKVLAVAAQYNVHTFFIQPGPFEFQRNTAISITGNERTVAMEKLVHLYESLGFYRIQNKILHWLLVILYRIFAIDEDAYYCMVYHMP
jgi:GNAT superfamily N-acetyltransferase